MSDKAFEIPTDPDALRAFTLALCAELQAKDVFIDKLKMRIAVLERTEFGRRSEKMNEDLRQLRLLLEGAEGAPSLETENGAPIELSSSDRETGSRTRKPLGEHLPRETVEHPVTLCPHCGGSRFCQRGVDRREVLEYVPACFKVVEHIRPRMSCRSCERMVQMPMPPLPIERGRPGPALLAHVVVSKYADHLPLNRQSTIYARAGVHLSRQVLAGWLTKLDQLLQPLADAIGVHARGGPVFHIDDTKMPILEKGRHRTREGRLWCVVRDERPWSGEAAPAAFYRHAKGRSREDPERLVDDCSGYMHADADQRFTRIYNDTTDDESRLKEVACWAHARRRFYDAWKETGSDGAHQVLELMGKLFALEADHRGSSPGERLAARQATAVPLLEKLKAFLTWARDAGSTIMPMHDATRYMLDRWDAFARYTTDGRLEMSNNAAERAIRPTVIGRKNYMFCGSDAGAERAASFYTIIESTKMNGLDPEAYLGDIIARIGEHPINRIDELLPWNWRQTPLQEAA